METFKKAVAFLLLLAAILVGAEVATIIYNDWISFRFDSDSLNGWMSNFTIIVVYGIMISIYVGLCNLYDKYNDNNKRLEKLKLEDEERIRVEKEIKARKALKGLANYILSRMSEHDLIAIRKFNKPITLDLLVWYSINILKPQEQSLEGAKKILNTEKEK